MKCSKNRFLHFVSLVPRDFLSPMDGPSIGERKSLKTNVSEFFPFCLQNYRVINGLINFSLLFGTIIGLELDKSWYDQTFAKFEKFCSERCYRSANENISKLNLTTSSVSKHFSEFC